MFPTVGYFTARRAFSSPFSPEAALCWFQKKRSTATTLQRRYNKKTSKVLFETIVEMSTRSQSQQRRRANQVGKERKSREDLFSQRRKKSSSTASEAQFIQKSLMRTQTLLKNELQRVSHVAAAIDEDGKVLQATGDLHKSLNTKNAQKALTSLERAQRQEQRVLMCSVAFFFFVSFYVMWSRVLIKFDFISILWSGW